MILDYLVGEYGGVISSGEMIDIAEAFAIGKGVSALKQSSIKIPSGSSWHIPVVYSRGEFYVVGSTDLAKACYSRKKGGRGRVIVPANVMRSDSGDLEVWLKEVCRHRLRDLPILSNGKPKD